MIRRLCGSGWELVRQPDHAALAADLLACLADRPQGPAVGFGLAVAHHDDGWRDRDSTVRVGADAGPETFLDLPLDQHLSLSEASVRCVDAFDPYAAAVVAGHVAWLHAARPVAQPDRAAARDEMVAGWRALAAERAAQAGVDPAALAYDLRLCAVVDYLSLWLSGWPTDAALSLTRPGGGVADAQRLPDGAVTLPADLLPASCRLAIPVVRVDATAPFTVLEHGRREVRLVPA